MIDLRKTIAGMARVTPAKNFPDASAIAEALRLEMTKAILATMKGGNLIVRNAMLGGAEVYIVAAISPRQEFYLSLKNARLRYRDIEGEVFGDDQRIQQSKFSEGFAIVFQVDGLECALTADSPDAFVDAIFCRPPSSSRGSAATKRSGL